MAIQIPIGTQPYQVYGQVQSATEGEGERRTLVVLPLPTAGDSAAYSVQSQERTLASGVFVRRQLHPLEAAVRLGAYGFTGFWGIAVGTMGDHVDSSAGRGAGGLLLAWSLWGMLDVIWDQFTYARTSGWCHQQLSQG